MKFLFRNLLYLIIITLMIAFLACKKAYAGIETICDDFDKVASIIQPYMNQAWPGVVATPSGPVPVITTFVYESRQPIADFCRYVKTVQRLDTMGQISATGNYANTLTNDMFAEDMNFLQETMSVGTAINNHFQKNDTDKRRDMGLHRRINRYLKTTDRYFKSEDSDATAETRNQRQNKMARMIRNSNRVFGADKISRCKNGELDPTEEEVKEYEENIYPQFMLIDEAKDEVSYYMSQLQIMGQKMSSGYEEFREYQSLLYQLVSGGVTYFRSPPKTKSTETYRKSEKERVKVKYYEYSTRTNSDLYKQFIDKYNDNWGSFVAHSIARGGSRGLLNNPTSSFNNEIRAIYHECRRSKIEWQIRRSSPNLQFEEANNSRFKTAVDKRIESCKRGIKTPGKKANGLLVLYVNQLRKFTLIQKQRETLVWSYESEFMGNHRTVSLIQNDTDIGDITRENVKCEDNLNYAESERMKLEVDAAALESREMIAEEMLIKSQRMEQRASYRQKLKQESRLNKEMSQNAKRRRSVAPTSVEAIPLN